MNEMKDTHREINPIENENQLPLDMKKALLWGRRDFVMDFIAIAVVVGFFAMTFLIAITPRDGTDHDVLTMLVGQLSAGFIGVLSFFFGNIRKP